ncbi:hypothetical protein H4R19_000701 [Coemansia spiralis]|nr:hypothetical protein H4R19_000701 [Coemansia spiralis]
MEGSDANLSALAQPGSGGADADLFGGQRRVSSLTKEAWIRASLKKRRGEFLTAHGLDVFAGTWNVNGRGPATGAELSEWLGSAGGTADVVVLGFQELDVRAEAFVYNNAAKDAEWTEAVEAVLAADGRPQLEKIASKQLIGMFVMVYARAAIARRISGVQTASVGCGLMGMVGNKGAVAVRLAYMDTPICFVCAHLAHDAAAVDKRNAQFHDLCKRLVFAADPDHAADPLTPRDVAGSYGGGTGDQPLTLFDHSYVVWLGDLNYRLAIDTGDMADVLARGDHVTLLGLDQLRIAQLQGQAFAGFSEGEIRFRPTYKFAVGTSSYDERRRPAWCDRVLWWARPGCEDGVRCGSYTAAANVCMSDHKPVRARLAVDAWTVDSERRHAVYLEVLRELDRFENECIPTATLEATVVDFGKVCYGQVERRRLRLANSGQVPLEYSFVSTPSRSGATAAWLRLAPDGGMLLPEQAVELELTVLVDQRTSAGLSTLAEDLYDILVLHLRHGRDYFIQVQGAYQPSVFGMSLDVLVHCKGAVRTMSNADFEACIASGRFSVPKCIWGLTDFLSRHGVDRGFSLFQFPGDRALERRIRDWLDTDTPLDPAAILQWPSDPDESGDPPDGPDGAALAAARGAGLTSSRVSLTDQTLVSSTMQSAWSAIDAYHAPSTVEALERLSLGVWGGADRAALPGSGGASSDADSASDSSAHETAGLPTATGEQTAGVPIAGGAAAAAAAVEARHDTGVDTVASCLVELLRALPEPLVPVELHELCIEAGGISRAAALEALETLPPGNLNVLVYLLAFLREAVDRGAASAHRVATVLAPALLRPPPGRAMAATDATGAEAFLELLLQTQPDGSDSRDLGGMSAGANCTDAAHCLVAWLVHGVVTDSDSGRRARFLAASLAAAHALMAGGGGPGTAAQDTATGRRLRMLWFVVTVARLPRAPGRPGRTGRQVVAALGAEQARLRLLLQALWRAAGSTAARVSGAPCRDAECGLDDIAVPATSAQAAAGLVAHMDRLAAISAAIERGAQTDTAWQLAAVDQAQDPLLVVQGVADALAAHAEALGVTVAVALPGTRQPADAIIPAAFPEARAECTVACDAWTASADAVLPMHHILLHAASTLLEHYMDQGDQLWLVPRTTHPDRAGSDSGVAAAALYLVCRRRPFATQPQANGSRAELRPWGPLALAAARMLATALYGGRAAVETRWLVGGSAGGRDARGQQADGPTCTDGGDWLVACLHLPGALRFRPGAGPAVAPLAEVSSVAAMDLPLGYMPGLREFQGMLRGARIALRPPESGGGSSGVLRAVEQYLADAGCVVEQLKRQSPGQSRKLVAQRPPAYVVIGGSREVMSEEFDLLRGTLSFASSSRSAEDAVDRAGRTHEWPRAQQTGTLGIIVLAAATADTARLREHARALAATPHPLPPPVVAVVPAPLSEMRLLAGLRAAWNRRRMDRHRPAQRTAGSPQGALRRHGTGTRFEFAALQHAHADSVLSSTPSSPSDAMYRDVRTVSADPVPLRDATEGTEQQRQQQPDPTCLAIKVDPPLVRTMRSAASSGDLASPTSTPATPANEASAPGDLLDRSSGTSGNGPAAEEPLAHGEEGDGARTDAALERGLSKTRTRIRDKMAQFNRARHRARNRLLGINDSPDLQEPGTAAAVDSQRGPSLDSVRKLLLLGDTAVTEPEPAEAPPTPEGPAPKAPDDEIRQPQPLDKAAVAQDRKAKLRARLQNANRRLAESQKAGGSAAQQQQKNQQQPMSRRGSIDGKSTPVADSTQPKEAAAAAVAAGRAEEQRKSTKSKQAGRRAVRDSQGNSTPPIRVLLVEDNLVNRSVMERFLTHMNVHYDVASNGEEAIRMWAAASEEARTQGIERATAANGPYHIVFMDLQMPLMDGITATKHIRRLERQKHIGLWVPTGSVASMHAWRTPVQQQQQQQNRPGAGQSASSAPPRTVRWVPFHLRSLPPASRNERFLNRATTPAADQLQVRVSRSSAGGRTTPRPVAASVPLLRTTVGTPRADEDPVNMPLVSPDDLDVDSLRQIAMFPPNDAPPEPSTTSGGDRQLATRDSTGGAGAAQRGRRVRPLQALRLPDRTARLPAPLRSPLLSTPVKSPVIIVALTASSLESDRQAALAAGCNDFLTKPVGLIWLKLKIIEWGCMQALIDYDFFWKRGAVTSAQ